MVQLNFMNGLAKFIGEAELVSKRTYSFWSMIGDWFVAIGFEIVRFLLNAAYWIIKFILNVVDLLQYFVKRLIGLDYWGTAKVETDSYWDSDIIFRFIKNDVVQKVFTYMLGVFAVLIIVFTIFAIIKSEYAYVANGADNSKKVIFTRAFKGILMVVLVPILLVVGIMASNAVLQGIVNAFALNNNITFGGQVFVGAAYRANKYKIYANGTNRTPTSTSITIYYNPSLQNYTSLLSDQSLINDVSLTKTTTATEPYHFDTTLPVVIPRDYGGSNRVTGYVFCNVSGEKSNTEFFWMTYSGSEKLTPGQQNVENAVTQFYLTKVMKYSLVSRHGDDNYRWDDMSIKDLDEEEQIIQACYNSWGYNEYLTQVLAFESSIDKDRQTFVAKSGHEFYSAYKYTNSAEWGKRYDGGVNGLVALPCEYNVMGDFMNFMVRECISCSIVDITNKSIDWTSVSKHMESEKYYNEKNNIINQFMVEYANEGYVVYEPAHGAESELEGAIYIMCYYNAQTGKYIPVLANTTQYVKMSNLNGTAEIASSYKFESDFLGENYRGFIVARGGFDETSTTWVSEPGLPTYISAKTSVTDISGIKSNIKLNEKYNVNTNIEYVQFNFEKESVELIPETINATEYLKVTEEELPDGSITYKLKWDNDAPLALYDEIETIYEPEERKVFKKIGIAGEKSPFQNAFNTGGIQWTPTGYMKTNEYGNYEFGFQAEINTGNRYTFLLEYTEATGEIQIIACDNFYYTYQKNGTTYYLFTDGEFRDNKDTITNGTADTSDDIEVAVFNYYNMRVEGVEYGSDGLVAATSLTVDGYTYGTSYTGKLVRKSFGSDLVGYAKEYKVPDYSTTTVKPYDGFVYKIDYYNYYTSIVGGKYRQFDYTYSGSDDNQAFVGKWVDLNGNTIAEPEEYILTDIKPIDTEGGIVKFSDIYLGRNTSNSKLYPTSVLFHQTTNGRTVERRFIVNDDDSRINYLLGNAATEADLVKAILSEQLFYQYTDSSYSTFEKIESYTTVSEAREAFSSVVVKIDFINERPGSGEVAFDRRLHIGNLLKGEIHFRFKLGMAVNSMESVLVESFEDGEFFLDYNFTDAGPRQKTIYAIGRMDYLILVFASILLLKTLGTAVWGLIARIYEITLYFLVMPGVASMYPLESGEKKFIAWRDALIKKVLGTYGVMIGLNAFFILLAPIREASKIFNQADMARMTSGIGRLLSGSSALLNELVYILFMLVAFTMIQSAPKIIAEIVGGEEMLQKGNDVRKKSIDTAKSALSEAQDIVSGKKVLEAMSAGKHAINEAKGFLPLSALYTKRNKEVDPFTGAETKELRFGVPDHVKKWFGDDDDDGNDGGNGGGGNSGGGSDGPQNDPNAPAPASTSSEATKWQQKHSSVERDLEKMDEAQKRAESGGISKRNMTKAIEEFNAKNENSGVENQIVSKKNKNAFNKAALEYWNKTHADNPEMQFTEADMGAKGVRKDVLDAYKARQNELQASAARQFNATKFTKKHAAKREKLEAKKATLEGYIADEERGIKHYSLNKKKDDKLIKRDMDKQVKQAIKESKKQSKKQAKEEAADKKMEALDSEAKATARLIKLARDKGDAGEVKKLEKKHAKIRNDWYKMTKKKGRAVREGIVKTPEDMQANVRELNPADVEHLNKPIEVKAKGPKTFSYKKGGKNEYVKFNVPEDTIEKMKQEMAEFKKRNPNATHKPYTQLGEKYLREIKYTGKDGKQRSVNKTYAAQAIIETLTKKTPTPQKTSSTIKREVNKGVEKFKKDQAQKDAIKKRQEDNRRRRAERAKKDENGGNN